MTCPTYHKELIDGREAEKPLPKNLHAFAETSYLSIWQPGCRGSMKRCPN